MFFIFVQLQAVNILTRLFLPHIRQQVNPLVVDLYLRDKIVLISNATVCTRLLAFLRFTPVVGRIFDKTEDIPVCPRHVFRAALSNPTLQRSIPKRNRHPRWGVCFFLAERVGLEPVTRAPGTRTCGASDSPWVRIPRIRSANAKGTLSGALHWRREWDSNPRRFDPRRFSRPVPSTTRPSLRIALGQKRCPKAGFLITIRIILHRYYAKLLISSSPALRCRPDTYAGPRERQRCRRRAGSVPPVRAGCGW